MWLIKFKNEEDAERAYNYLREEVREFQVKITYAVGFLNFVTLMWRKSGFQYREEGNRVRTTVVFPLVQKVLQLYTKQVSRYCSNFSSI